MNKKLLTIPVVVALIIISSVVVSSYTPAAGSPLANHLHPRLFFTPNDIGLIKSRIMDYYKPEFQTYVNELDANYGASIPSDYMLYFDGRNYAFLCAVDPASMNGITTGHTRAQYCQRAVEYALSVGTACHDTRHDFGQWWYRGGCKMTVPIIYDWTYDQISTAQRAQLVDMIITQYDTIDNSDIYPPFPAPLSMFSNNMIPYAHNVILGSIAIWGDSGLTSAQQQKAQTMLDHMNDLFLRLSLEVSDANFGGEPGGRYPELKGSGNREGPAYYLGSTVPALVYPVAGAWTALGENFFSTSSYMKYIPDFLYYKIIPFPIHDEDVDGFYSAWHDSDTPHDLSYGDSCDVVDCFTSVARVLRFIAFNQNREGGDSVMAAFSAWMIGESPFKIPVLNYKYADGIRHYGLFGYFLGGEREIVAKSPTELNLPLFKRVGDWTFFKSSHDMYDSTWMEIDSPVWDNAEAHNRDMASGILLAKYGNLIVRTVATKSGGSCFRADTQGRSPAFGSITGVYSDPAMSYSRGPLSQSDLQHASQMTEGSPADVGDVLAFDEFNGVDVFGYDYSKMYKADPNTKNVVQYMVYFRGSENNEFFVEDNFVDTTSPKRKLLHHPADVVKVSDKVYSVTNTYMGSHAKLYTTSVYPEVADIVTFGGPGLEWAFADGTSVGGYTGLTDSCRNIAGYSHYQVRSDEPQFVTVYQPGDSNTLTTPAQTTKIVGQDMKGVLVNNNVALFPSTASQTVSQTGYSVTTTATSKHVLAGFTPLNTYTVSVNGVDRNVQASRGGVLYFEETRTGALSVSVGGGTSPVCVDVDGDGYGVDCNLGSDCNDNDASVHPGAVDVCGNGVDEDCSGSDLVCSSDFSPDIDGDGDVDMDDFVLFRGGYRTTYSFLNLLLFGREFNPSSAPVCPNGICEAGETELTCPSDCSTGGENYILEEGFEGVSFATTKLLDGGTQSAVQSAEVYSGTKALELCAGSGCTISFYEPLSQPGDIMYSRYMFKIGNFEAWYDANGNPLTSEHYKNPGLVGGDKSCHGGVGNYFGCISARSRMFNPNYGLKIEGFQNYNYIDDTINVVDGGWHCFEEKVKLNTYGQSDGELSVWIDGHEISATGLEMRKANDPWQIDNYWWTYWSNDNWVGPIYMDDVIVSKTRIGCPGNEPPLCIDNDNDGYGVNCNLGSDCNDNDASVHPGAVDVCGNGVDEDCSGSDLVCQPVCVDVDGDGFGVDCALGPDCNDNDATIHPGAVDICDNGVDEDCSGADLVCQTGDSFTFVAWADTKKGTTDLSVIADQVSQFNPVFTLYPGDLVNSGFDLTSMNKWKQAINGEFSGSNVPSGLFDKTFALRGNHDDSNTAGWQDFFNFQQMAQSVGATNYVEKSGETDLTYSFDYGNSHFVGVDVTGSVGGMSSSQISWLDSDITAAENRGLVHTFVFFHGPFYCVDGHCSSSSRTGAQPPSALVAAFNNHPSIVASFHGHEHVQAYVHMDDTRVSGLTHPFDEFIVGSAGASLYSCSKSARIDWCDEFSGFAVITVSGSQVKLDWYKQGSPTIQKTYIMS